MSTFSHFGCNNPEKKNGSIIIIADHPGATATLSPVIENLIAHDNSIFFALAGIALLELPQIFNLEEGVEILGCSTILLSTGDDEKQVQEVAKLKKNSPDAQIVIIEDVPNSTKPLVKKLIKHKFAPTLWLVNNYTQAKIYKKEFPQTLIINIGMPGFDIYLNNAYSAETNLETQKIEVREKLKIPHDAFVIAFAGAPAQDKLDADLTEQFSDLNSVVLKQTLASIVIFAEKHPAQEIYFVYKPHPREKNDLWEHPLLDSTRNFPSNLTILQFPSSKWKDLQSQKISTFTVSTAADVQLSATSTVNYETAIAKILHPETKLAQPLFTMFLEVKNAYPEDCIALETPITPAINSVEELAEFLTQSFDSSKEPTALTENITQEKKNCRLKSPATPRVYLWLKALEKWGAAKLIGMLAEN